MSPPKREAILPREVIERVLDAAGTELIVVGGQSLAFWMDRYGISMPAGFSYVSRDLDLLAPSADASADVRRLARALGGRAVLPRRRMAITALVGQAVKDVSADEFFNVDVLHRVYGAGPAVRSRAVDVRRPDGLRFRVMHPLDVLKSRVDNLHGLPEKRNELGVAQLVAAIEVARAFQREAAREEHAKRRSSNLRHAAFIEKIAKADAGRKVARRHGIHVADAVEADAVSTRSFHEQALPRLARLMSPARRDELGLRA